MQLQEMGTQPQIHTKCSQRVSAFGLSTACGGGIGIHKLESLVTSLSLVSSPMAGVGWGVIAEM